MRSFRKRLVVALACVLCGIGCAGDETPAGQGGTSGTGGSGGTGGTGGAGAGGGASGSGGAGAVGGAGAAGGTGGTATDGSAGTGGLADGSAGTGGGLDGSAGTGGGLDGSAGTGGGLDAGALDGSAGEAGDGRAVDAAEAAADMDGAIATCFDLTDEQCGGAASCEVIARLHAPDAGCGPDDGGASACVPEGCRPIAPGCVPSDAQIEATCSNPCASGRRAVSPTTGCHSCVCVDDILLPHSMKGWEAYGWTTSSGLRFSLLEGTNRNKTCPEIVSEQDLIDDAGVVFRLTASSLTAFKTILARAAAADFVSYLGNPCGQPEPGPEVAADIDRFIGSR